MTPCPRPTDKLHLLTNMALDERARLAEEEGIGVELSMNLFGWQGPDLAVAAQVRAPLGADPAKRFHVVGASAFAMSRGFGVDSLTLVGEGFVAERGADFSELPDRFARGDLEVSQAIWISHIEQGDVRMLVMSVPYRYVLRGVEWGTARLEVEPPRSSYSLVLKKALEAPLDSKPAADVVAELEGMGMLVETF
jgi:hypothetical protein